MDITDNKPTIEEEIVKMLKTVYDPEIPVNIYDLGLVYDIEVNDGAVKIAMTLTAPNCPAADFIIEDVRMKLESIENVKSVDIQLVFEPEWDKDMMSDSGVDIHWFIGNHDIWIFDYLPHELGITIHDGTLITEIGGKRFFLSHGDNVGHRDRSFRLLRSIFRNRFCQRLYAAIHPRWTVAFALRWSAHSRKAGDDYAEYRGEKNEHLVCFAKEYRKEHPIDCFIFGHRHILLDLALPQQSRIVILGDWIKNPSYAVFDETGLNLYDYIEE